MSSRSEHLLTLIQVRVDGVPSLKVGLLINLQSSDRSYLLPLVSTPPHHYYFLDIVYIFKGFAIDPSKKYMKTTKNHMKIDAVDP